MLVSAGSTLLVPRNGQRNDDVSERLADSARLSLLSDGPALRRVALKVGKRGDSIAAVAKRYAVSAQQVAQWNNLSAGARLAPGSTVVVYVPNTKSGPVRGAAPAAKRATAKKASRPVRVATGSATRRR
jgi:membrane-bound lytic murein transglycosylase D